jgi:hypothetical protein
VLYLRKGEQGKKKRKRLLYTSIVAQLFLILSIRGMSMNQEEELATSYSQSVQLETVMTNYFECVSQVETFDDVVDCNTKLRAGYDYYKSYYETSSTD